MHASVFEVTRFGSGTVDEGPNHPRMPNAYTKHRSICTHHKKHHEISVLTIMFPNGMSMVIGVVSVRN